MITYVNNSNAGQYRVLYEKATRDLMAHDEHGNLIAPDQITSEQVPLIMPTVLTESELAEYESNRYYKWDATNKAYVVAEEATPGENVTYYKATDITSLNEYFSYIKNLAEIDPLYTVLPLDEDVFDVNLNTRKISIPQHFKDNGVSVQGDEIAEVLYFKVNRFFDAQDLAYELGSKENDRMRIYIQWRSSQEGEDGKLIEGVSVPWVVDLTTYPNYILFGWPISSKVTGKEGKIDFAVRFFKFQDRNITYSLSTLTHTVEVRPSLDFDITKQLRDVLDGTSNSTLVLDDNTEMILDRLANSEVIANGTASAGKPYFYMATNPGPNGDLLTKIDSTVGTNAPDFNNGIVVGYDNNGNSFEIQTSEGLVKEFWLARNNTTGILDVPTTFRVQGSGDGRISYTWKKLDIRTHQVINNSLPATNEMFETTDTEAQVGKTYYKAVTNGQDTAYTLVVDPIFDPTDDNYVQLYERYSVAPIDGVGYYKVTISNRVQNSLAKKESIEMVVALPLKPKNNTAVVNTGILYPSADYALTLITDAEPQDNSVLTYQWYYAKNGGGVAVANPIEGATGSTYTIQGSATADTTGADGDGYYYVIITSNMNGEKDQIEGNENGTRVTHPASRPDVIIPSTHKESYSIAEIAALQDDPELGGLKVQASIPAERGERPDYTVDGLTYQWFRYQPGEGHTVDQDREAAARHEYTENEDILLEGATTNVYVPQLGGFFYYCKVTNTYNGTTADAYSPFFYITA